MKTILDSYPVERRKAILQRILNGRIVLYAAALALAGGVSLLGVIELSFQAGLLFSILAIINLPVLWWVFKRLARNDWRGFYLTLGISIWTVSDLILINLAISVTGMEQSYYFVFFLAAIFSAALFLGGLGMAGMSIACALSYWLMLGATDLFTDYDVSWSRAVMQILVLYLSVMFVMLDNAKQISRREKFMNLEDERVSRIGVLRNALAQLRETGVSIQSAVGEMNQAKDKLLTGFEAQSNNLSELRSADEHWSEANSAAEVETRTLFQQIEQNTVRIAQMAHSIEDVSNQAVHMDVQAVEIGQRVGSILESARATVLQSDQVDKQTETTTAAIQEARRAYREVGEQVTDALGNIRSTAEESQEGRQRSDASLESIDNIGQFMQGMSQLTEEMGAETDRIEEILETIHSITNRTGLLALNASIVASQAGAHGKSFNVVATEIRTLAEASAAGAKNITDILERIRSRAESARSYTRDGISRSEAGKESIQQTADALMRIDSRVQATLEGLKKIEDSVKEASDQSQRIEEAAGEIKSAGIEMRNSAETQEVNLRAISKGAESLADLVKNVSTSMTEQSGASHALLEAMREMRDLTDSARDRLEIQAGSQSDLQKVMTAISDVAGNNRKVSQQIERLADQLSRLSDQLEKSLITDEDLEKSGLLDSMTANGANKEPNA